MAATTDEITLVFHKRAIDDWICVSLQGAQIELLRIDGEWVASLSPTYDPYGETQHLNMTSTGQSMSNALLALCRLPGIPYFLAISEHEDASLLTAFPRVWVSWGITGEAQPLAFIARKPARFPRRLEFERRGSGWCAYYLDTCRIEVTMNADGVWVAHACSIRWPSELNLSANGTSPEVAVRDLLSTPGIPVLFGLTEDRSARLRRFTQRFDLDWQERPRSTRKSAYIPSSRPMFCPRASPECQLDSHSGHCVLCGDPFASHGWAYAIRWDD